MDLLPAIDLKGGRVVQLREGDFDSGTDHGSDPVGVARRFEEAGAAWIHMVDLDAARTGDARNRALIESVCRAVRVPVQAGGGVRSLDAARALADLGVARVVMGTAAVENPDLVARVAAEQEVAIGLDVRGREVSIHGWTVGAGMDVDAALMRLETCGASAVVVTQIIGEGMLSGPDLSGLGHILSVTDLDVIASGGVGTVAHLVELAQLEATGPNAKPHRLAGTIVGTALYSGHIEMAAALAAVGNRGGAR